MNDELIKQINKECEMSDQGIFFQPYGIPVHIKEHVIYMRYETGGYSGGSCWDNSDPTPYYNNEVPDFEVLDVALKYLMPNISYLQYKQVEKLILTNEDSKNEYYGNSTDYKTKYIIVKELEDLLKTFE